MQFKLVVVNNSNQSKCTMVNLPRLVLLHLLLDMVNLPLLVWIHYYHQFELSLTNLTNLLNDLTYR